MNICFGNQCHRRRGEEVKKSFLLILIPKTVVRSLGFGNTGGRQTNIVSASLLQKMKQSRSVLPN